MRNVFFLVLLGAGLLTAALVTRSGILARKDPGRPINKAMREALDRNSPQWSTDDAMLIAKTYGSAHKTPSGLQYIVRARGTGEAMPTIGNEVTCHYDGRFLDGAPLTFRVGMGSVIRGWEDAFMTMRKGEKRTLIIPYWLAYGEKGRSPTIPPKATLVFDVELIDWR